MNKKINPANPPKTPSLEESAILQEIQDISETRKLSREKIDTSEQHTLLSPIMKASDESETGTIAYSEKYNETKNIPSSQIIQERYQILKLLGEGGMGVVQLVKDRRLQRDVALKKIKTSPTLLKNLSKTQASMIWRLKREASIMAVLEHPNIVPLYDLEETAEGSLYFTMRKVEGETFNKILKKKEDDEFVSDENQLLSIFLKVCDAISYAHAKGVIHRDIKPDNIMVGAFGEVYVMDWGISKIKGEAESEENMEPLFSEDPSGYKTIGGMGTPGYMSPEQQNNAAQVTPQSDIYALGKMLKECFIRISPIEELKRDFEFARKQKKVEKFNKKLKENLNETTLPADIQAIVHKATQKNLKQRYLTVTQLTKDIESYLKNIRVSARHYSFWELLQKWTKRNWKRLSVGTLFVGFILSIFWYSAYQQEKLLQDIQDSKKKNFLRFYQEAQAFQQKTQQEKDERKNIDSLLTALTRINTALAILPEQIEAEKEKAKIGQQLIPLACKAQNYKLAMYISNELESLSTLPQTQKLKLKEEVQKEEEQILKQHQQRFNFWINNFKTSLVSNETTDAALFEISQMEEPEILEALQTHFEEGKNYFLEEDRPKNLVLNKFYLFITKSFGKTHKKLAMFRISEALKVVVSKLRSQTEFSNIDLEYTNLLLQAMSNFKAEPEFTEILNKNYEQIKDHFRLKELFTNVFREIRYLGISDTANLALQHFNKANDFYWSQEFLKALSAYTKVLEINSKYIEAYIGRAQTKFQMKDFKGGMADFQLAIQIDPKNHLVFHERALLKMNSLNDPGGALKDFDQAILLKPYWHSYMQRGNLKRALKDIQGALDDFSEAIKLNPFHEWGYNQRGNVEFELKQFNEAIEDYSKAILLQSNYVDAFLNRGNAKRALGQKYEALADYEKAVEFGCRNHFLFLASGAIRLEIDDLERAFLDYNYAIYLAEDKLSWQFYLSIGSQFFEKKKLNEAITILQQGVQKYKNSELKNPLATVLMERMFQLYKKQKI
ncbi:MAG: protein kinase [Planctomycetota bacterium]